MPTPATIHAAVDRKVIPLRRLPPPGPDSFSLAPPAGEIPERDWVAAIRAGDEGAFEQMFLAYFDRLQAFAESYVQRPEVAEEVVGSVFVRLWEQRERWEVRQSLKSYLYTAVRNQALMWIDHQQIVRRTREAGVRAQQSPGMGQAPAAADEELEANELADAVAVAIDRLPERAREVYVLSRQEGLSYAEIAEAMGISLKTVENHLGRALRALREELSAFLR